MAAVAVPATPVPEPGSAGMALLGGLALWGWRLRPSGSTRPEPSDAQRHQALARGLSRLASLPVATRRLSKCNRPSSGLTEQPSRRERSWCYGHSARSCANDQALRPRAAPMPTTARPTSASDAGSGVVAHAAALVQHADFGVRQHAAVDADEVHQPPWASRWPVGSRPRRSAGCCSR